MSIYYKNLIRGSFRNKEEIVVSCSAGEPDSLSYNLSFPVPGLYDMNIEVVDSLGILIEQKNTKIKVNENNIQAHDTLKVLFIGDSYTYDSVYLQKIMDLYTGSTYYPIVFLGTKSNQTGILHEGYLGKSWNWFANSQDSPFVFDSYGNIDCARYFDEKLNGDKPDIVVIFLGINDIGSADPQNIATIDVKIDEIFNSNNMMKLVNSLKQALPEAEIGIVQTPPTNEREYSYTDPNSPDYGERKVLHHRLAQRYKDHFNTIADPFISTIPVNINIDTFYGFNEPNGFDASASIHPNIFGYGQIGTSVYLWIKNIISKKTENISIKNVVVTLNRFSADISWEYPISGVTYNIYRSADPYGQFELIATTSNLYFTDTNTSGSNHYFYKITAEDSFK